jgi:ABC-type Zn uptake system ZnuABC Zn-binding protein ZnuA
MSALTNADLITRKNGKYFITSLGKIVYEAHTLIGRAHQNYWKLKAVDTIESSNAALAREERGRLINSLIEDKDLKQILLSGNENKELLAQQQSSAKIPLQNIDF